MLGSWKLLGASQRPCRAALLPGWDSPLPPSQGPPFSPEGIRKTGRPWEGQVPLSVLCPSAPSDLTLPLPGPLGSSARKDKGRGPWEKHGSSLPCSPEGLAGLLEGSACPTLLPEKPAGRRGDANCKPGHWWTPMSQTGPCTPGREGGVGAGHCWAPVLGDAGMSGAWDCRDRPLGARKPPWRQWPLRAWGLSAASLLG